MTNSCLLGIHAMTALHAGTGSAMSVIDLPIQREAHTHWPSITGSSIKGVMRDSARERLLQINPQQTRQQINEEENELTALFGPGRIADPASTYAGALNFTDARLIAFPVRSVRGVYALVTCPMALHRLQRDSELCGGTIKIDDGLAGLADDEVALPAETSPLRISSGNAVRVMFDEFDFSVSRMSCSLAASAVAALSFDGTRVQRRLAVVHDDVFTHFVRYATEVTARIGLDYETKTVRQGALFYEEFLPAESLLYCMVQADRARRDNSDLDQPEKAMRKLLDAYLPPVLQIGANATTGKGICRIQPCSVNGEKS